MELLPVFRFVAIFAVSAAVSLMVASVMRRVALRFRVLATPGGHRRHENGTPLLGGVGLFTVLMLVCVFAADVQEARSIYLFAGITSFFFFMGVGDDFYSLRGFIKLLFQIPAAGLFVWLNLNDSLNPDDTMVVWALCVFWILMVTNGINFIDGFDGLCSGIAFLISVCLAAIVISWNHAASPFLPILIGFAGAILGFLKINMHPARMFLGDSGSLLLGCALSTASLLILRYCPAPVSSGIESMILCFMIPIADCVLTVLRRIRLRRPLFDSDWGHIHHRLMETGLEYTSLVRILWSVQVVFCGLAWFAATASIAFRHVGIVAGVMFAMTLYGSLLFRERRHARYS